MTTWSIGELAAQTGLTVRTLRHYDEIGLARPSCRTSAGHRRYDDADLRRLHRIVALRDVGFRLAEIGELLDEPAPDGTARGDAGQPPRLAREHDTGAAGRAPASPARPQSVGLISFVPVRASGLFRSAGAFHFCISDLLQVTILTLAVPSLCVSAGEAVRSVGVMQ